MFTRKPSWCKGSKRQLRHLANASKVWQRKFWRNFKVIPVQSHPRSSTLVQCQSKAHMQLPLVINSNFARISYCFRDTDAYSQKIPCFPHPTLVWTVQLEIAPFDPPTLKILARTKHGVNQMIHCGDIIIWIFQGGSRWSGSDAPFARHSPLHYTVTLKL